jgi:hypothetical protein
MNSKKDIVEPLGPLGRFMKDAKTDPESSKSNKNINTDFEKKKKKKKKIVCGTSSRIFCPTTLITPLPPNHRVLEIDH